MCILSIELSVNNFGFSSQSVARLNNSWSNDPKVGPRAQKAGKGTHRGGFGGRDDLEETRRYRDSDDSRRDNGYGMVFDVGDSRGGSSRRKRSRSADGEPRHKKRSRSRSPRREKDRERRRSRERGDRRR